MGGNNKDGEKAPAEPVALPAEVMKRVDALTKLQEEKDELEKKHDEELRQLELKYLALYQGTYAKRKEIVSGAKEVEGVDASAGTKGIPDFWLQCMQNHPEISNFIEPTDVPALKFLEDVSISYHEKLAGFTLTFTFRANPYFDNETLSKEYVLPGELPGSADEDEEGAGEGAQEGQEDDGPIEGVKKIQGTDILWKSGKNLCVKMVSKRVKGGRGKPKKTVQKQEEVPSFFRFFETPDMNISEDMEAEEAMEIVNQIQSDIAVAQAFRDEILPEAVRWFTGEAAEEYEGEDDDDEDDDGEDDEDDDEEDEDDAPPARGGRGRGGAKGKGKGKKSADEDEEDDDEGEDAAEIQKALTDSFNKKMNVGDKEQGGKKDEKECKQQ